MKIGNIDLPHGLILAPMAGFSDYAMRAVARACGADMTVSEMVSAKALCYGDKKTPLLARVHAEETPMAVQLFGAEPQTLAHAAAIVAEGFPGFAAPAAIDINMGCPMPKITGNGEGSALMKNPALCEKIVDAVVRAVKIPVTVKIRAGYERNDKNAVEVALRCEAAGAAAVTVHGRTRAEYYEGLADRAIIRDVVRALKIPVIGNGDIRSASDALSMMEETGCAGVAVARGAIGNPTLFTEIAAAIEGREIPRISREEKIGIALRQLRIAASDKGEYIAVRESRKQFGDYIKGLRGGAALRLRIATAETIEAVETALRESLTLEEQN